MATKYRGLLLTSDEVSFPYIGDTCDGSHLTYVLTKKSTGYAVFFRPENTLKFKEELLSAIQSVKGGNATLTAVWSGNCISKVFLVDDLALAKKCINSHIQGRVEASPVDFEFLRKQAQKEREEAIALREEYKKSEAQCIAFLKGYKPDPAKEATMKEIAEMLGNYRSAASYQKVLKDANVQYRLKSTEGRRTVRIYPLDEAIKAIKEYYFKPYDNRLK